MLEGRGAAPSSPLVPLKSGVGKPLFIAPGLGGDVPPLAKLGEEIGLAISPHPVFAIQAKGLDGTEEPLDRVEDMVAYYLAHLRGVQPHGPYFLAGYSFGGIIAMEMARGLTAAGETVALLAFFDSFAHPQTFPKAALQIMRLKFVIAAIRGKRFSEACAWFLRRLTSGAGFLPEAYFPEEGDDPASKVLMAAAIAQLNYWPVIYPGRVEFFRPEASKSGLSPRLVWGRLLAGLTVHAVPGDHWGILGEHAPFLASVFSTVMHRAAESAHSKEPQRSKSLPVGLRGILFSASRRFGSA